MNQTPFIIFFLLACGGRADLLFGVRDIGDGAYIPSYKEKYSVKTVTEDSLATSPEAMSIADGVSEPAFHSGFLANYLTKLGTAFVLTQVVTGKVKPDPADGYRSVFADALRSIQSHYFRSVGELLGSSSGSAPSEDLVTEINGVASTFITAFIEKQGEASVLNIVQRGDSSAIVFRPTQSKSNPGKFHYRPIFLGKEQQHNFNSPFHFGQTQSRIAEELSLDAFVVEAGDVVVVGSDGLFDNLHVNFISFAINYLVAAAQTTHSVNEIVDGLAEFEEFYEPDMKEIDLKMWPPGVATELQEPAGHFQAPQPAKQRRLSNRHEKTQIPDEPKKSVGLSTKLWDFLGCFTRDNDNQKTKNAPQAKSEAMKQAMKTLEEIMDRRNQQLAPINNKRLARFNIDRIVGSSATTDEEAVTHQKRVSRPSARNSVNLLPADLHHVYADVVPNMVGRDTNRLLKRPTVDSAIGQKTTRAKISETLKQKVPFYGSLEKVAMNAAEQKVLLEGEGRRSTSSTRSSDDFSVDVSSTDLGDAPLGRSSTGAIGQTQEEQKTEKDKGFKSLLDEEDPEMDEFEASLVEAMFTMRIEEAGKVFEEAAENAKEELFGLPRAHGLSDDILGPTFADAFDKHFDFAPSEFQVFADKFDPLQISTVLATAAKNFAGCSECLVPFRANAFRWNRGKRLGGKKDDISVLANIILDYLPPSETVRHHFAEELKGKLAEIDEALKAHIELFLDFQRRINRFKI